ncbi:MAG: hypothetical protein KUG74_10705 [Rhodobacteraceae bacterium]|nr:hypothetical protein [Paracoccaceae bacterium]
MEISDIRSEHLDDLQDQIAKNAHLMERGRLLMQIVSETGAKGMSPKGLIRVAEMFADGSVVTGAGFLRQMNFRRQRGNATAPIL